MVIISLVQSAEIFKIQILTPELEIKLIIRHWGAEPEKVIWYMICAK